MMHTNQGGSDDSQCQASQQWILCSSCTHLLFEIFVYFSIACWWPEYFTSANVKCQDNVLQGKMHYYTIKINNHHKQSHQKYILFPISLWSSCKLSCCILLVVDSSRNSWSSWWVCTAVLEQWHSRRDNELYRSCKFCSTESLLSFSSEYIFLPEPYLCMHACTWTHYCSA